ncbi:MAG: HAMP domain-containing histidine kinase [Pirellulales bacterium]|nr:HAMP domain-containing histidine kinase [Pirellulales bacterium]
MRRPIQVQLLVPLLTVVLGAIVLASLTSALLGSRRVKQQQEEQLQRVVSTLAAAGFPLTDSVLEQMSGLSGAEFVLLDQSGRVRTCTLPLSLAEGPLLAKIPGEASQRAFSGASRVVLDGRAFLADRVAVGPRGSNSPAWLVVLCAEDRWWAATHQAAYPALVSGGLAALVVVVVTALLARRFVEPIRKLVDQTAAIAGGRFEPVAVPRRNDEIRDLAVSINRMTDQLTRYEAGVRRSERLRTLGRLGAAVAHQLRNSATGARMAIELHGLTCPQGGDCESLQVALRQLGLMESYLQRFLTLGRPQTSARENVDLAALVDDALDLLRPMASHTGVTIEFLAGGPPTEVLADREALHQLVINLAVNAMEAARRCHNGRGWVVVELLRPQTGSVVLRVTDSGPGVAAAIEDKLFEPFATDKPQGAGLGLFVAREVAEVHGGSIHYEHRDGATSFSVELPRILSEHEDGALADRR